LKKHLGCPVALVRGATSNRKVFELLE
jgi:hypothetical protein